ncbi:MAG: hypothetical protein MAG715_00846 [Methanonatronarchaeales archaeon]|nr:hypothetical protein [Methanonatronarchaeales archaeon]
MEAWRYRDHPFLAVQGSEEEVREVVELLDEEMGIEVESIEMPSDMPRLFKCSDGFRPYLELFGRPPRFFRRVRKAGRRLARGQWRLDNFTGRYLRGLAYRLLRKKKPKGFEGQRFVEADGKGYLRDIYELNGFNYFDHLQRLRGWHTQSDCFTVKDAFKTELARIKLAVPLHKPWLEMLESWDLRQEIGVMDKRVPSQHQYHRLLAVAAEGLDCYFSQKRLECYRVGLMGSPLKIWDRRFFKVYFTKDPEAGSYKKPRYRGEGYTNSSILDAWWGLPDYFTPYNAKMSDQVVFPHTFKAFMRGNGRDFIALLSDGGPDSHPNNRLVLRHGKIPIIHARGNAVGEVVKTPGGHHFRGEYIPRELWPYLDRFHDARPAIERRYSLDKNYALTVMPHEGREWAWFFIGAGEVLHLLNALTAYKKGELGLIRSSSAFRRVYSTHSPGQAQWSRNHPLLSQAKENLIYA